MVPDPITGENVFGLGGGSLQRDLGNLFAQGSVGTFVVIVPAASLADSSWGTNAKVVERWALLGADIEATMSSPSTDTAKAARKGIYAHMAVDPRPRLWIAPAPTYTPDALDIGTFTTPALETELANLAADMRGIAIIDADAPTSFGATFTAFSTLIQGSIPSAYVVSPRVIDTDGSVVPISPYVAGTIAATEGEFQRRAFTLESSHGRYLGTRNPDRLHTRTVNVPRTDSQRQVHCDVHKPERVQSLGQ